MTTNLKVVEGGNAGTGKERYEVGSPAWAERIRRATKALATKVDEAYMQLAEQLWLIYDTPADGDPERGSIASTWKDKDGNFYGSFDRWVEAEVGIHYKKAGRLRLIWKTLKIDLELSESTLDRIVKLGFSRVRELVRPGLLTMDNVDAWISKAEGLTYLGLSTNIQAYLSNQATTEAIRQAEKAYNGSLGSTPIASNSVSSTATCTTTTTIPADNKDPLGLDNVETHTKHFACVLFGDQIETVKLAMQRASELSNSTKAGHNLSMICLDFLSTNDFKFANEQQRLRFLAKYESLTGLKLIIVDPDADEVIYGFDTLKGLATKEPE